MSTTELKEKSLEKVVGGTNESFKYNILLADYVYITGSHTTRYVAMETIQTNDSNYKIKCIKKEENDGFGLGGTYKFVYITTYDFIARYNDFGGKIVALE